MTNEQLHERLVRWESWAAAANNRQMKRDLRTLRRVLAELMKPIPRRPS